MCLDLREPPSSQRLGGYQITDTQKNISPEHIQHCLLKPISEPTLSQFSESSLVNPPKFLLWFRRASLKYWADFGIWKGDRPPGSGWTFCARSTMKCINNPELYPMSNTIYHVILCTAVLPSASSVLCDTHQNETMWSQLAIFRSRCPMQGLFKPLNIAGVKHKEKLLLITNQKKGHSLSMTFSLVRGKRSLFHFCSD